VTTKPCFDQLITVAFAPVTDALIKTIGQWWQTTKLWADEMTISTTHISAAFKIKPKGLTNYHVYKLSKFRSKIERELEEGNITYIELSNIQEHCSDVLDWDFYASFGPSKGIFIIDAGLRLRPGGPSPASFAVKTIIHSLNYSQCLYGFAVIMPRKLMPGAYVIGVASAELPDYLVFDADLWESGASSSCDRNLRNVYGLNLLGPKHLKIPVGGQTLEEWIASAPGRGRLQPFAKSYFLWTFQEENDDEAFLRWDCPSVVRVREELKKYRLFYWQDALDEEERMSQPDYRPK
jgi:hypothetical protein